jgi:glycosyltransferase involved in cell wall biosynthesis
VAELRRRGTPVELWVAGPGDQGAAVHAGGLDAAATRLLGTVAPDDLLELYRTAWVTALPARAEAFGLVLVESLACGTPVLALDQGGPRDIVTPDVGRLVDEDEEELAAGLLDALDLSTKPAGVDACRTASLAWDWRTAVVPHLERLYGG